jgi:hypothetical protein
MGKLTTSRRYNLRTLAAVKPWGDSEGACRVGLTRCKSSNFSLSSKSSSLIMYLDIYYQRMFVLYAVNTNNTIIG